MQSQNNAADNPLRQVDEAEKAIEAGNFEEAGMMMYRAVETAMIGLARAQKRASREL